ncbi:hypothetical protein ACLGI4_05850 [Streptomyces sp. HMX112]|uniref:hypothetical protein n=1 Tax=Streptomyces sp. HMX112 TaxID=3390850 RepID=UPI003A81086A
MPASPAPQSPRLALPLAFEAFCILRREPYLAYAQAHLGAAAGADAVAEAFGDLVTHWSTIVASHNPAAGAWEHFTQWIAARSCPLPIWAECTLQYQVVVLHDLADCSLAVTAEATGQDPSQIRYFLHRWRRATSTEPSPL